MKKKKEANIIKGGAHEILEIYPPPSHPPKKETLVIRMNVKDSSRVGCVHPTLPTSISLQTLLPRSSRSPLIQMLSSLQPSRGPHAAGKPHHDALL